MRTTLPVVLVLTGLGAPGAQIPEQDARNIDVHNSGTHYSMPKFTSRDAWRARAAFLRKQIPASAGLLPMPEKRPIHAEVFGKMERNGFEKVLLETWPGFYLGGDLYRRSGKREPFPAVVSPHGHWPKWTAGERAACFRAWQMHHPGAAGIRVVNTEGELFVHDARPGFPLRLGEAERASRWI